MQLALAIEKEPYDEQQFVNSTVGVRPFKSQLLKWIGNKQRFAHEIISFFPKTFGTYHEPFLGSAAVLGVLSPKRAEASDCFAPLIEIWQGIRDNPELVIDWYRTRWEQMQIGEKVAAYEAIKASYNAGANGADLLFLCRSCYGGVVRFRMRDGYMSTPCGVHAPIHPGAFARRVAEWRTRVAGTEFFHRGYEESLERAQSGDVVYCDPPYSHSQAILYGAQAFSLDDLFRSIEQAKRRGVFVALSIDGSKKSGDQACPIEWPKKLFAREEAVNVGRSMLRRFQMAGETLEAEVVSDRLLITH
ncbi:DNA adenine methylase [Novosphingobium sp. FGD1]|uniref:site-specific DNA-methyltransferase (adenine-specific) n=1 Tax=Novosphingobium silvae TaxID=2692619 RepID=A0A7X4GL97_9SPHN|nr:DNA adenine methylase [Novosphingobium silvae]MYM00326.1 DNA adenine methylase [Novosphingobium silvae]